MRIKFKCVLTLFLALFVQISFAQEKTVSGTVTDVSGLPLPGVNILVKGTTNGVQSDLDGQYTIKTNVGEILVFSYISFVSQSITVGDSSTINVSLTEDVAALDEVVITALGIKREQKSLGYAVSKVGKDQLEQKSEGDLGRLLQGKASGVNITASNGLSGSSSNIVIRGNTSITGDNQALFVIDGIPFSSGSNQQSAFFDNVTESNRFLDIDPNNIEDITILKGLSATALYGNRGRNGVILITTKSGSGNKAGSTKLSITQSVFTSSPHLPTYQDEFGGGFNNNFGWFFSNWGPRFTNTNPSSYGSYFGRSEGNTVFLTHPFATNVNSDFITGYEDLAASEYEYRPYDSVENFFRTGINSTTNINVSGGNDKFGYNVGYTKFNDEGFTPGNELSRDSYTLGANGTIGKFKINAAINLAVTDYKSPPIAASRGSGVIGGGASIFSDIFYTPRNVDLIGIPFERQDGGSLYYRETNGIQHPLWTVQNSKTGQRTTNIFTSFNTLYQINDNLFAAYRFGFNTYTENGFYAQNKGGIDGDVTGVYRTTNIVNSIFDHNVSLNYEKDISEKINFRGIVGFNSNRTQFDRDGVESRNQVVFGVLRHFNFTQQQTTNSFTGNAIQARTEENTFGAFADLTLAYDDYLYLNMQGRKDWTSTLETGNNSIFYPSASLSFIPTAAIEGLKSNGLGLNYLKMRFGFGSSAGFPPTYTTRTALSLNGNLFVNQDGTNLSGNDTSSLLGNPDLKPERVNEIELGLDSKFLDNRVGLNVSVFKRITSDLITDRDLPPSEGFTRTFLNAGELENKGIELDLNADIFRNRDGFSWNIGLGFYADEPIITKLPDGVDNITIGGSATSADARNAAVVGQPYGVFLGSTVETDADGNRLVDESGVYVATAGIDNVIGDPNADFTANFRSSVSYKNLTLSLDLAYRHGGDVYSRTISTLQNRGVIDFPLDRDGTYVLPGVSATTGEPNNVQVNATDIAFDNWLFGPSNFKVYDGSMLRINEVSLSYVFSKDLIKDTPFTNINITLLGSNLWYRSFNTPKDANFDVNVNSTGVGNNQGLDFFSGPSAARVGFSVKLDF